MDLKDCAQFYGKEGLGDVRRSNSAQRHLPLTELAALHFRAYSKSSEPTAIDVIGWLGVETSIRYQPDRTATYCNVYAFDYCYLNGVYLPRIEQGPPAAQQPEDTSFRELSTNRVADWLTANGAQHGWRPVQTLDEVQAAANDGFRCLIIAKGVEPGAHGHIAVVLPETDELRAIRSGGIVECPVQSHAGAAPRQAFNDNMWWLGKDYGPRAAWINPGPLRSLLEAWEAKPRKGWRASCAALLIPSLVQELRVRMAVLATEDQNLPEIDATILAALVAAEDRRFYRHSGFDLYGIVRAVQATIFRRHIQGASTIEQQLVRTLTNRRALTISRKFTEILAALWLSSTYEKNVVARVYLRNAYYGSLMNGLQQAKRRLNIPDYPSMKEACALVACLRYPLPLASGDGYVSKRASRAAYIEGLLGRETWITR